MNGSNGSTWQLAAYAYKELRSGHTVVVIHYQMRLLVTEIIYNVIQKFKNTLKKIFYFEFVIAVITYITKTSASFILT